MVIRHQSPFNAYNSSMATLLKLKDVQVRRSGKIILDIDDFSMAEGESIALLGPNGSGKSTFVNLVTREVFPLHRGIPPVVFRSNPRMTLAQAKACTGVVSSSMQDQIRAHLRALDVVVGGLFGALGVPIRKTVTAAQRDKAKRAMEELGIVDLADRDILTLSTGQARRVLIARALVHDPEILVFDEPCAGLDPEGMYYVRRTIRKLAGSGRSILLVTHSLEDVITEINRVVLLKDGRIQASGPKEDMLTGERLSRLFDIPIEVDRIGESYCMAFDY